MRVKKYGNFSNNLNPSHAFTTPGFQKIKATVVTQNRTFVLYKTVIVFPPPLLPPNQVLTQCDTDNDGFSIFNLEKTDCHRVVSAPPFLCIKIRNHDKKRAITSTIG